MLLLECRELVSFGDAVGRNAWLDCGDMLCLSVARGIQLWILREILCLLLYAWLDSGYMFYIRIWLLTNFAHFLRRRGLGEVFFSVLTQNREGAHSMLRPSSCCAARTWNPDIISTSIRG